MFTVIFYYLLSPLVDKLEDYKLPRAFSIIIIYIVISVSGILIFITLGALAYKQLIDLANQLPDYLEHIESAMNSLEGTWLFQRLQENGVVSFSEVGTSMTDFLLGSLPELGSGVSSAVNFLMNFLLSLVLLPILLFYALKDGESLRRYLLKIIPADRKRETKDFLKEIDQGLSSYIQGQIIVSLAVGILSYIGFVMIRLNHALVFAFFAIVTNFIPYLGVIISTIPAVIIGFGISTIMGIKVLLVVLIVQQIEGFFITPHVMGKKLDLHPLLVIVVLIIIGNLAGFFGLILAVPIFVVLKIVMTHLFYFLTDTDKSN